MTINISIFDCGCVPNRPKESSCKSYGTRWRVFLATKVIKLKCRDCGRVYNFDLVREGVQRTEFDRYDGYDLQCEPEEAKTNKTENVGEKDGKNIKGTVNPVK
jgi:hypothetical protein